MSAATTNLDFEKRRRVLKLFPMQLLPTWDLFIIVFFAIIIAYSFIVGRNSTLKIVIASYLAILTADGFGNMIDRFFLSPAALVETPTSFGPESLIIFKILILL